MAAMMKEVDRASRAAGQGMAFLVGKLYEFVTGPARALGMMRGIESPPTKTPQEKRDYLEAYRAGQRRINEERANAEAMDRENQMERNRLRFFFDPIRGARVADESRIRPSGVTEDQFNRNVVLRDQYRKLDAFVKEASNFVEGLGKIGDTLKRGYRAALKESSRQAERSQKADREALEDMNRADADTEESRQREYRDSIRNRLAVARRQAEAARDAADQRITLAEPADVYRLIQEAIRPSALERANENLERIAEMQAALLESNDFGNETLQQIHDELNNMNLGFR
jgi:hypothetical protein